MPRLSDIERLSQTFLEVTSYQLDGGVANQVRWASVAPCRKGVNGPGPFRPLSDETSKSTAKQRFSFVMLVSRIRQRLLERFFSLRVGGSQELALSQDRVGARSEGVRGSETTTDTTREPGCKVKMTLAERYLGIDDVDNRRRERGTLPNCGCEL